MILHETWQHILRNPIENGTYEKWESPNFQEIHFIKKNIYLIEFFYETPLHLKRKLKIKIVYKECLSKVHKKTPKL